MEERLPYYMVYPMPLMYDDEKRTAGIMSI